MAEMVYDITEEMANSGCSMITEERESYDGLLRNRKDLRKGWYIVRKDETMITTSPDDVTYSRILYRNRERLVSMADMPVYSIPYAQVRKIVALKNHIWEL